MAGKVLSVEVGVNVTRICLTDYKVKSPRVYKYTKIMTPPNVIADGEVQVTEEFVNLIKTAVAQNKMACKQAVFAITSSRVASREISIPLVKEKQIEMLIRANVTDYFPIDLSQYEIGHIVLGKDADKGRYRVQVLAVPQNLLESYKQLASACGLQMVAADYSGNSIYQMVKGECREGVKMVVKVDENSSIVTVIKNQAIVLQRTVSYGVDDAVHTILENRVFGALTYEDAIELACRKTCMKLSINAKELAEPEDPEEAEEDIQLLNAKKEVASSLGMLINGIGRIMDYYSSRNSGETVDKIYITGLGSDFSGLGKLLTNELGIKALGLKHLEGQTLERSFKDGRFGEYITCVGAVISPVGLMGAEKGNKKNASSKENDFTGAAYLLLIGGTLIAVALVAVSILGYTQQKSQYDKNVQRLNDLAEIRTIYAAYTATRTAYEQVEQLYAQTENHNEELLDFLAEMEVKMPAEIQVKTFSAALDNITMTMTVGSKEEMANAVQELRNFNSIDTVSIMGVQDKEDEEGVREVTFTISCIYKSMEQMAAEAGGAE